MAEIGAAGLQGADPEAGAPARLRARMGIAVVDHGVSAGTNLLVTLVAARSLGADEFGVFGVLYLLYLTSTGVIRALVGEPALVRVPHPPDWQRDVLASGLVVSAGLAALIGVAGSVVFDGERLTVLVLAVALPAMSLQDLGRYLAFASRRPHLALHLDLTWAGVQVIALGTLAATENLTLASIVATWAVAGALGGLHALWANGRAWPRPHLGWVQASWVLSWRYLVTFATTAGIAYVTAIGLGAVAGVAAVGALRGAQVLFGPLNVLFAGVIAAVVPDTAGRVARAHEAHRRLVLVSVGLAATAVAVAAVVLALPDDVGRALLGDSWSSARELIVPVGLSALLGAVIAGADIGLRAARAVRQSLGVQLRLAPVQLVVPLAGAAVGAAAGYAWALAGVTALAAVLWWFTFERFRATGELGLVP